MAIITINMQARMFMVIDNFSTQSYIPKNMDTTEYVDDFQTIKEKVKILADLISKASHPVFFTGAGISTGSGIPDFRSGYQTIIKTGPGRWESEENK